MPSRDVRRRRAQRDRQRAFRARQPADDRRRYERKSHLRAKFGMTLEEYDRLLDEQCGVCAICHRPEIQREGRPTVALSVDHDHQTGRVRGLLCSTCNHVLGEMGDSPDRLRAAAVYLERFRSGG